ncbi:unnamed protein product [Somion occarium]|uniref:Uncharacterized protein n=1 Tax=Somion occarium TaxID=3059160 RepID=A0ABP1CIV7_9APHY
MNALLALFLLEEAHKTDMPSNEWEFDNPFKDMIWDYECFNCLRTNWPQDILDVMFEEHELVESSFNIPFLGSPLFSKDRGSSCPNFFGRRRAQSMSGKPSFKRVKGPADLHCICTDHSYVIVRTSPARKLASQYLVPRCFIFLFLFPARIILLRQPHNLFTIFYISSSLPSRPTRSFPPAHSLLYLLPA